MRQMRRVLLRVVAVAALGSPLAVHADVVELFDGTRIETESITLTDGMVTVADGRTIPRNDVRHIAFGGAAAADERTAVAADDAEVQALLRKAQAAREEYPDVGAITLIDDGEWTLNPDGTQLQRTHGAQLILKEPWKALGQVSNWYEEGRERARLVLARTISPDGTVHEYDPADLKEVKPSGGMVSFSRYKSVAGQLPQVEIGSIVETIWETETYNPYDKELFFPRWYFGGTEPVLSSRISIRVPQGRQLYYKVDNLAGDDATPKQWDEDGYHVHQWELQDIEHIVREPAMPPVGQVVPNLAASLFKDWGYIFDFLGKFQQEHMEVTPELEAQVAEIVGETTAPEEQLAKIYHWLQREIRYISIKGSMGSGWSGHPATLTLQNKYGDCIDKSILFATMLKVVGIKAAPVIIMTNSGPADDRSLPTMYGNHAITEVELNGRTFHLDSTATTFRYPYFRMDDHGVKTINVVDRKIGETEIPSADDDALDVRLRMRLDEEGNLKAIAELTCNGGIEAMARMGLEQINKMFRKMAAQQALNEWSPGAELKQLEVSDESDLTKPLEITLKLVLPQYPTFAGDLMVFEMPLAEMSSSLAVVTALDERRFDVQSPTTMSIRQHTEIELPEGYIPKGLPDAAMFTTPYTSYHASYSFDGQKVVFEDNLSLHQRVIPAEDYADLKNFMEDVTDFTKVPLFLYKAGRDS